MSVGGCGGAQVDREALECDTQVVPEVEVVQRLDHVVLLLRVVVAQVLQQLHLNEGLLVEALLVADDLERAHRLGLVVVRLDHLPEGALAELPYHLVPVADVVVHDHRVVAALVVVAVVGLVDARVPDLLPARPDIVDLRVVQHLRQLVVGQLALVHLDRVLWCDGHRVFGGVDRQLRIVLPCAHAHTARESAPATFEPPVSPPPCFAREVSARGAKIARQTLSARACAVGTGSARVAARAECEPPALALALLYLEEGRAVAEPSCVASP